MIGEWNDGGTYPKYHRRMNLTMSVRSNVRFEQILRFHSNHCRLLLLGINVLHQSLHKQVRPRELFLTGEESLKL